MTNNKKKTYDRPMKGESAKSFRKYKIYEGQSPDNRSIGRTADILLEEEGITKNHPSYENRHKKMVASLKQLSAKWFWVERSLIHDADDLLKEAEEHKQEFKEVNKQLINCFKMVINSCEDRLISLNEDMPTKEDGRPYSILSIIKITYEITVTLKIANEQIRLCFGLPTDNTKVYHDVEQKVKVESTDTLEMIREVDEELADLYEPNTEHTES